MDSRTAAAVLQQIAGFLELTEDDRFRAVAYVKAARALGESEIPDIAGAFDSGELSALPGVGPAISSVLRELADTGRSAYLEKLRATTPTGLVEMSRIPGLGLARVRAIRAGLGVETVHDLEAAARDGRLAALPRFGARTAERVLKGIQFLRSNGSRVLFPTARDRALPLLHMLRSLNGVAGAEVAGALRRHCETVDSVDLVAACGDDASAVCREFASRLPVAQTLESGGELLSVQLTDGIVVSLHCTTPPHFVHDRWSTTGSREHVAQVAGAARARGITAHELRRMQSEEAIYSAAGLTLIAPELRENLGEIEAAAAGTLPTLVESVDIRGVLHCHSRYSDGNAEIEVLAAAAMARGWSYLGISDHSQAAAYAGGLNNEKLAEQHREIAALNSRLDGFRVLRGIEADILADGRLDLDDEIAEAFDYVIGSVHSRFSMNEAEMTARVLRALEDPRLTILGHPTGRLLLARDPYALDLHAVLDRAGELGVAVELNADPHRLDLDWRLCRYAVERGVMIEIGPDAHSVAGLANMEYGIGIARKGWLAASNVLNCMDVDGVLRFARARGRG